MRKACRLAMAGRPCISEQELRRALEPGTADEEATA